MNIGMVLVLFILLVIVTQAFWESSISSKPIWTFSTEGFNVFNNTSNYRFILSNKSGSIGYPPSSILNSKGGSHHYELVLDAPTSEATATYTGYDLGNQKIGEVEFRFKCVFLLGVRFPSTSTIKNTAPVNTSNKNNFVALSDQ